MRVAHSISGLPARGRSVGVRTFRSLHVRNYRLWFVGQTISQSGSWMQSLAQSWLVYKLTGSALDLGITAALQFAPVLVFGTIGGLVAGRVNKRTTLLVTQSAFLLQSAVLSALLFTGVTRLWMVWVLASVYGLINVVDNPTRQIFVMEMVGREDLTNAVALNSVIVNASRIAGPAVAGVLILAVGLAWTFAANAATFVAVIAALLAMRTAELHHTAPVRRAAGQIRAGLRYAWHTWELRVPLLMMAVVGTLSYNFSVIMPLLASRVFHHGAGTLSGLTVAMGIGALGGGLFTAARRRSGYRLLVTVTLAFGLLTIAVAMAPSLIVALVLLVPMGAASVSFIATGNSLLQLHSTGAMRGRVMGLWAIVFLGSTPIGGPLTGFLAAHLGTRVTLAIGGSAAGAGGLWRGAGVAPYPCRGGGRGASGAGGRRRGRRARRSGHSSPGRVPAARVARLGLSREPRRRRTADVRRLPPADAGPEPVASLARRPSHARADIFGVRMQAEQSRVGKVLSNAQGGMLLGGSASWQFVYHTP